MIVKNQRLPEIDLLRGIALLGIFLMNIDFVCNSNVVEDWNDHFSNAFDFIAGKLKFLLLAQRFIGIFSLLFGLSVAIQKQNFERKGVSFNAYYFKRSAVLAVFGIMHILFFFMGDILLVYSLLSLLLFFFFKLSNRAILISALLVFIIPSVLDSLEPFQKLMNDFGAGINKQYSSDSIKQIYQSGTMLEMMKARLTEYFYYDLTGFTWNRTSFAMMLLGYTIGRNNLHINYVHYWKQLKITAGFCAIYYIALILYFLLANVHFGFWINMLYHLHVLVSIILYTLLILIVYKSRVLNRLGHLFSNAGKMSLSNYMFQSIVCAFIFTHYGFALFSKTTPTYNVFIVCSIYIFQLIASTLYLRKFKTGPLEWLWHKLVY